MLNNNNNNQRAKKWMEALGYLPQDKNLHQHHLQMKNQEYQNLINKYYTEAEKIIFNKLEQSYPAYPNIYCKEFIENQNHIIQQYMNLQEYEENKYQYELIEKDALRTYIYQQNFESKQEVQIPQLFFTMSYVYSKENADTQFHKVDVLKRILYLYVKSNKEKITYQSGMNFILAIVLLVIENEADAFFCFNLILNKQLDLLLPNQQENLQELLKTFDSTLKQKEPQIFNYLEQYSISSTYYSTTWFMTCFTYQFNKETIFRIWDHMLIQKDIRQFQYDLILRLLRQCKEYIFKIKNFEEGIQFLNGRNEILQMKLMEILNQ